MSRTLILGAGFGSLELATLLSEALGEDAGVTLIDEGEAFVFGYSKLDVMFGRATPEEVRRPYTQFAKPGARLVRETITAIDPNARRVTTDTGTYQADVLAVALGADYDLEATPGLADGPHGSIRLGSRADARRTPGVCARARDRRHLRRAFEMPARPERGCSPPARLPLPARRKGRVRDLARHAVRNARSAFTGRV
jgi:hypothetical protein